MYQIVPGAQNGMKVQILFLRTWVLTGSSLQVLHWFLHVFLAKLAITPVPVLSCHSEWLRRLSRALPFSWTSLRLRIWWGGFWYVFQVWEESRLFSHIMKFKSDRQRKLIFTVQNIWSYVWCSCVISPLYEDLSPRIPPFSNLKPVPPSRIRNTHDWSESGFVLKTFELDFGVVRKEDGREELWSLLLTCRHGMYLNLLTEWGSCAMERGKAPICWVGRSHFEISTIK